MTGTYKAPAYMRDAPEVVLCISPPLAVAAVQAMTNGIKEAYPDLNEHSLEFAQLLASVFHMAEWMCLNSQIKDAEV